MRIPGLFPIAYSLVFPQFENSLSEMTIENDTLEIMIKNDGDYNQSFNYTLDVSNNNEGYGVTFSIIPVHHPNKIKTHSFNILVPDESSFMLESHDGNFDLNPNQGIMLSFNDNVLENDESIINGYFNLDTPYPNPFNPIINFDLNVVRLENITINIYDIKGNKIETIFSGLLNKGNYTFSWDGKNNATGIYIIQCSSDKITKTQKIFLMK